MTIAGFIKCFKDTIIKAVKFVAKHFKDMKVETLAKVGAVAGGAGVTVWLYVKTFKDHMKLVKKDGIAKSKMNFVDRGLFNNYNDTRNIDDLDDLMSDLKKSLDNSAKINTGGKKKKHRKVSKNKKERLMALRNNYDPKSRRATIIDELEQFKRDMDAKERDDEDEYLFNNYRVDPIGTEYRASKSVFEMSPREREIFISAGL